MSWFYRRLVRPVLFTQDSEEIHNRTLQGLAWVSRRELLCDAIDSFFGAPELPVEAFGLRFPNPVGLAAGMDKHASAVPAWSALGFGFSELGGVTWQGQAGNPAPRIFRAVRDEAIINRMGFNNPGAEAVAQKLAEWRALGRWPGHPVGINLGKSKITPLDKAAEDYAHSFRVLMPYADFFVVNVSSPNTPNLRQLQDKAALDEILAALSGVRNQKLAVSKQSSVLSAQQSDDSPQQSTGYGLRTTDYELRTTPPILVKVSPDLSFEALDEILELAGPRKIAAIIATNTTITRPETTEANLQRVYAEAGGLSGRPLRARSTEVVRHIYRQTRGTLPVIGVGGILSASDAWEKIAAGASLVQVYTGLIYEGPGVAKTIVNGLLRFLEQEGLREISQAVGISAG